MRDWKHTCSKEAMTLEGEMVLEKMVAVRSLADEKADLEQKLQSNNYACGWLCWLLLLYYFKNMCMP